MGTDVDPITLEVIRNALLAVTAEMKNIVIRTAVSPLWKDAGDVSCAVLTRDADLAAQGRGDIPAHLGTMSFAVQGMLQRIPVDRIVEGDALIQNDPYWGGNTHLPDYTIAVPVFANGELVAFSAVRGHWTSPFTASARQIYEEGLIVPPNKLYKAGELNGELMDLLMANYPRPGDRLGDLMSQYAGCRVGERGLRKIADKYGVDTLKDAMQEILNHSEKLIRAEIEKMPEGTFHFTDYLDDNGVEHDPLKIQVGVTIKGSDIAVDFTGTDEQTSSGINNTYAATASAVYTVIKSVTDPWNPVNAGCYRPVKVIAPEGTLVNCKPPAAVCAYHETQVRMCDAIFGALSHAVPERVPAAGYGSQGGVVGLSGMDLRPETCGEHFVLNEVPGGPSGGTSQRNGLHGTRVGTGNAGNIPVESVETHNPLMIEAYEIVPGTGGAGMQDGGCAVRRVYRIMSKEAIVTTVFERAKFRPYGLFGGKPGALAVVKKNPDTPSEETLPAKSHSVQVHEGDVILVQTAGGGGYGNPLERDPELVRTRVVDGLVGLEAAEADYGVKIDPASLSIDWQATTRLRESRHQDAK